MARSPIAPSLFNDFTENQVSTVDEIYTTALVSETVIKLSIYFAPSILTSYESAPKTGFQVSNKESGQTHSSPRSVGMPITEKIASLCPTTPSLSIRINPSLVSVPLGIVHKNKRDVFAAVPISSQLIPLSDEKESVNGSIPSGASQRIN